MNHELRDFRSVLSQVDVRFKNAKVYYKKRRLVKDWLNWVGWLCASTR